MIIVGAGNLGIHILDQLLHDSYQEEIFFFDNNPSKCLLYERFLVLKTISEVLEKFRMNPSFIVGIGHPRLRQKFTEEFEKLGGQTCSLIHPSAFISNFLTLKHEIIIQPHSVIAHDSIIGRSCILHTGSVIGHGVILGNYASIAPNVTIVGPTKIGNFVSIGANSVILPNLKIGNNVVIGAGSLVKMDLKDNATFVVK